MDNMSDPTYKEVLAEVGQRMAELEGKLDTGIARLEGQIHLLTQAVQAGNLARTEADERAERRHEDHEARLRAVEKRPTVSPAQLWAVAVGASSVIAAAVAIFRAFTG